MALTELCLGLGIITTIIALSGYSRINMDVPSVYQQVVLARQAAKTYAKRTVVYAQDNQIQVRYDPDRVIQTIAVSSPVSQNRLVGFTHAGRTSRAGTLVVSGQGRVTVGVGFGQIRMQK
ncbi:MAG: hypothetical protein ACO3K7_06085 [Candidatus Marinamargulisbacteria bacterium]